VSDGRPAAPEGAADGTVLPARRLFVDQPIRLDWAAGERARVFEIEAPRRATRRMRVRGPSGLAWALFSPGSEAGWRPRALARVTGFAGGSTSVELPPGVSGLVLFHDAATPAGGEVEIVVDEDTPSASPSAFLANAHELRRFVVVSLVLAFALALGEAGRTYLLTGNIWTTWGMVPIGTVFLLFPASFLVTVLWHTVKSMKVLRGEEWRRTPTFANRALELEHAAWPSVTIQIPIFRESFDGTIRPTLDAAREAARRYALQTGAHCNVLVCDDGLLHFAANDLENALAEARRTAPAERTVAQAELVARIAYYEGFDVAYVARPWPEAGVPGTERPGRFRKASNLNYALRLADRLKGLAPLSEAHARFRDAVPEAAYRHGRWRGDVRIGEIIVQLDKDSLMAPDVIRATVPEFLADPTLGYTQHASYPTNEDRYFSAVIGWFTRVLYDLSIRAKCLIPGTLVPLMGHNAFLRRADVMRMGAWSEHSVCEDLEMLLRLHESGQHGKYVCYPGHDFGEAVTRVFTEELEKFRRYAFGAAEAVLNPIPEWERRGVVKASWRRFWRSENVRWYQVVDLLQFFFSLVNLASLVPLALLTGLGFVHPYRAVSMMAMSAIVFGLVPLPTILILRRGRLRTLQAGRVWRTRFGLWKAIGAQLALSAAFLGFSLAVLRGALAHLFDRPLVFAETNTDDLGRLKRGAHLRSPGLRTAVREGVLLTCLAAAILAWSAHIGPMLGVIAEPVAWPLHLVWLYPVVIHAPAPLFFHPYLIAGPDLSRGPVRRRPRAGGEPRSAPHTRQRTAERRRGAA
jgi:cellulose synthase/poly-beta-1,6-N-acetylglucosamine synthase-like glycosyltransferase